MHETIFCLLHAIDDGILKIIFTSIDGKAVDLGKEGHGEMSGWFIGHEGWRAKYSKGRFIDDFSDLDLDF